MNTKNNYYYLYQIVNKINGNIYVGVHRTTNMNDGYMGSGKLLKKAIKKYGVKNFEKIILKIFDSEKEMFASEAEIVNEDFVKRDDTYNITLGGLGGNGFACKGMVTVRDKSGKCFNVPKNDKRYVSGELVSAAKGKIVVKDEEGKKFAVSIRDPRYISGELVAHSKGMVRAKDARNNILYVSKEDPRYLSGELKPVCVCKSQSEETKKKISNAKKGKCIGSKNSQFGTMWISNPITKEDKKIKKDQIIPKGWELGRFSHSKTKCAKCGTPIKSKATKCKKCHLEEVKENSHKKNKTDADAHWEKFLQGDYRSISSYAKTSNETINRICFLFKVYIPECARFFSANQPISSGGKRTALNSKIARKLTNSP